MNTRRLLWALPTLVLACSGGGDSGVQPANQPPTIAFNLTKLAVVRSAPTILSVSVDDPDDDPLTVSWSITRGILTPQNGAKTIMSWAVPATVGSDTVVVTVSDGSHTRKITEPVKVGWSAPSAPGTFLKSRSPYIITVDSANPVFGIDEGLTSTVEAGTELFLDNEDTRIDVTGRFVTLGTADEPVIIRPNVRNLNCGTDDRGWWESVQVSHSAGGADPGEIEFHGTEVWYAQYGVRLLNDSSARIVGGAIRCSEAAGVLHQGSGTLSMMDTEVSNGMADGIVIGSLIGTAIPDSVLISGCTVEFNERNGVVVSVEDPSQSAWVALDYNHIKNNSFRGMTLARSVFPAVHFNLFNGNGAGGALINIYLEDDFGAGSGLTTLNAACNYFAVTTQSAIDVTIRDSLDNPVLVPVRVDTDPWLTADPRTTTPTCTP